MIPRPVLLGLALVAAVVALFGLGFVQPVLGLAIIGGAVFVGVLGARRAWVDAERQFGRRP